MTASRAIDVAARAAAIAAPVACAAYGAGRPDSVLLGGLAWLAVLVACFTGYGHFAERFTRVDVDAGMRLAWGMAAYLMLAGWALAAGVLTHATLAGLLGVGLIGHGWRQIAVPTPTLIAALRAADTLRRRPHTAALFGLIAAIAAVNLVAAVARQSGNVYDDDIMYTPMVQRLLDIGDLDEPFSFRRISAYGGQTALQALGAVRGTLANLYLLDGALCQLVALLLVVGLARDAARRAASGDNGHRAAVDEFTVGLVLLVFVLLPDTSINTASYWSGVALFLALYRTFLVADGDRATPRLFAAVGVISAGICSLRQNYLPVAALFVLAVLVARLLPAPRARLRFEARHWGAVLAGGLVALGPYCVAIWTSNDTFLYPLIKGTFNPHMQMQPALFTAWQELQFFFKVFLEPEPYRTTLVLLPVLLLARDQRPGSPLTAFTIASAIGFVILVHSFALSDARNLWRYSFGYTLPLVLILVIEGSALGLARAGRGTSVDVPLIGRILIVGSLLMQLAVSGRGLANEYDGLAGDLQAAAAHGRRATREAATARLYDALQGSAPAGATIAVMLDEPFHLDYARNRIVNLDLPGFASYRPGMPFFRGPEAVATYFQAHGIRYLAFVRGDASRYMYRRDYWVQRLFWDTELWRIGGAYTVDCIDNFAAIAASRAVLFEQDGLVMVDLAVER